MIICHSEKITWFTLFYQGGNVSNVENLCWNPKNMVTRILTTLRFWLECVKTPHFLLFYKTGFSALPDEKLQKPFFQLAGGLSRSFGSVMAIDPLADSIPELSIDGRASAVLHLTGTKFLEVIPTKINLLGSCNFHLSPHSHLLSPLTTLVHHRPHNQTLLDIA